MQDLPENHLRVSGASWVNIIIIIYYYGEGHFSMDRSIISQLLLSFRSEPILCAGL